VRRCQLRDVDTDGAGEAEHHRCTAYTMAGVGRLETTATSERDDGARETISVKKSMLAGATGACGPRGAPKRGWWCAAAAGAAAAAKAKAPQQQKRRWQRNGCREKE